MSSPAKLFPPRDSRAELLRESDENAGRGTQPGGGGVDVSSGEGSVAANLRQRAPQGHRERGGMGIANRT